MTSETVVVMPVDRGNNDATINDGQTPGSVPPGEKSPLPNRTDFPVFAARLARFRYSRQLRRQAL